MIRKLRLPLFPLLFSAWPILRLYVTNIDRVVLLPVLALLAVTLGVCLVLLVALTHFLKDDLKAGMLVTFGALMFFTYGHIDRLLYEVLPSYSRGPLFVVWSGLLVLGVIAIARAEGLLPAVRRPSLVVAALLLVMTLVQAARQVITQRRQPLTAELDRQLVDVKALEVEPESLPDIYYIVLDEYGRADELQVHYGYDNGGFVEALTERGFYVAQESQSNYGLTFLSLASSLNMQYLEELVGPLVAEARYRSLVGSYYALVQDNEVARVLKEVGYTYILVGSGWGPTDRPGQPDILHAYRGVGEFNLGGVLYRTTMLNVIYPQVMSANHRDRLRDSFDRIGDTASVDGPTFLFAHLLIPHPPYVFRGDGSAVPPGEVGQMMYNWYDATFNDAYVDQIQYANRQVEVVVDRILAESERPPVIIIQADHGTRPHSPDDFESAANERLSILNAYYLPADGDARLYPSITPANSFRLVFDAYLGTDLGLLQDHSYISDYAAPEELYELLD